MTSSKLLQSVFTILSRFITFAICNNRPRNAFKKFKTKGQKLVWSQHRLPHVRPSSLEPGSNWLKKIVAAGVQPHLDCRLFTSQLPRTLHPQPFTWRLPLTHVMRCCSPTSCALSSPQPLCSNCLFRSSIPSPKAPRSTWRTASKVVREGATFKLNRNENRMAGDIKILRTDEAGGLSQSAVTHFL
jgi:hypothetical protein